MINTLTQERKSALFLGEWRKLLEYFKRGLRLTDDEAEKLEQCEVARYVAALPYAAGCMNPDRLAVMLVSLFVVEIRGESPFDTRLSDMDGTLERIEPYFAPLYATGGNPQVIDKAKYILGMKTFSHWIEETDAHPSNLDFVKLRKELKAKAEMLPDNELLDSILTVDDGMANTWWRTEP